MKKSIFILACVFTGLLGSCSSENVKSSKNYIVSFKVAGVEGEIKNDQKLVYIWTEASNYEVLINGSPEITVSPGASYSTSGDDWTVEGFKYIVTAENGDINSYSVQIDITVPKKYSFEVWSLPSGTSKYDIPSGSNSRWTSGNEGISWALPILKRDSKNPENYPTRKTTGGYSGNAVLMETVVGDMSLQKPLFSGNLILGNFNFDLGKNELDMTEIGRPYPSKPKKITGYYKYKEGPGTFMNNDTIPHGPNDSCSMIVTFYRSDLPGGGDTTLTVKNRDNDNSSLIIAETRKQNCSKTTGDGFHSFELKLEYSEEPDFQNHRYKLGMSFASSKDGDNFSGKIGSKLIVDEIEIIDF